MSFMSWQLRKLNVVNGAKSGIKRNSFVTNKENARLITNELRDTTRDWDLIACFLLKKQQPHPKLFFLFSTTKRIFTSSKYRRSYITTKAPFLLFLTYYL